MRPTVSLRLWSAVIAVTSLVLARSASADSVDDAKQHFTNGVHLFEDKNFAGALVEFEASFQTNPTAAALQNIGVCQKALFRYADAIATLERMLRDFGPRLSPEDKKAAEDAIREMTALLGSIVVKVTPADAKVSVNGNPLVPEAMRAPIRLAAGEYRIRAEASGFSTEERMITVVSGQKDVPVVMTLPQRPSAQPNGPPPSAPPSPTGVYAFLHFGPDSLGSSTPKPPAGELGLLGIAQKSARVAAGYGGIAVGYRFSTGFAAEFDANGARHAIDVCRPNCDIGLGGKYELVSSRVGPAVRFMTSGRGGRLVGTIGLGAAVHTVNFIEGFYGSETSRSAVGSYIYLAGAYEFSLGHFLLDAGLNFFGEAGDKNTTVKSTGALGLELRLGYGAF